MEYFLGQIIPVAFPFAPKGTAFCQGQLMPVTQNRTLAALLGPTFGGDGATNFGLPDARGRALIGADGSPTAMERRGARTATSSPSLRYRSPGRRRNEAYRAEDEPSPNVAGNPAA